MATRPAVGIGLVSYGWYLWHWPILSFMAIADFGKQATSLALAGAALSFLFAVLTYRWVELPARAWRRRIGQRSMSRMVVLGGVLACGLTRRSSQKQVHSSTAA